MRIKSEYSHTVTIQKSRFIAYCKTTKTEEEAREYINEIKGYHTDATHVCTAYALGANNMIRRSNDNGEPSGTAGVPILEAIINSGISDVTVCVVRYFGGIKLGAGGLIRAYGGVTTEALRLAPKTIEVPVDRYEIAYPYEMTGTIETWLRRNTTISNVLYEEKVIAFFETEDNDIETKLSDLSNGKCIPKLIEHTYTEKDVTD